MTDFIKFGDRKNGIGGTDAKIIASGDWNDLWEEKMGLRAGPNLDHIFKVQLGKFTEPLHAEWYTRQTGHRLIDPGNQPTITRQQIPGISIPIFATFDRWIEPLDCPLEMKHTHAGNSLEEAATYYMAQLQHQLIVAGRDELIFSIIRGNEEPVHGTVAYDPNYAAKLLELERTFWGYVERNERPPQLGNEAIPAALAAQVPINGRKPYDLSKNNEFVSLAADWQTTKIAADRHKEVNDAIRKLIPADASIVTGGGLQFKRDARGAFRCTILESADASPPLPETTEA